MVVFYSNIYPDMIFSICKAIDTKITSADTMAKLNFDLKKLRKQNYKYIFIDEITMMKDFIDSAAILSDTEIKQYLKELDLISEYKIVQADLNISPIVYIIFTQPGMRYCQAQVLVHSLMKDSVFGLLEKPDQDIVCDKILEDVRGRMLEDIVLLETYKAIDFKRYEIFKLRFDTGEFDMVIYDHRKQVCGIYEIKHSDKFDENQYRHLADEEKCALTECRFGKIVNKTVLYRGENFEADNGISYLNVEEYLNDIENLIKLEPIQEEMMTQDGMTMI